MADTKENKIKTRWQWKLRFKSQMAPSRGVWDVLLETNSPDYDRARVVADHYLTSTMAHPSTKFIMLEPAVAWSEDEMLKALRMPGGPEATTPRGSDASEDLAKKAPIAAQAPFSGDPTGARRVGQ